MSDAVKPADIRTASPAEVVAGLTLEQKAALTSGADFWNTEAVESAGIPSVMLTDGPHGVRKQRGSGDHLGIGDSVQATCFPPAVALGSTFDPALLEAVGRALGEEARTEEVAVLLGPGINLKRSPLCGRNFEYLSEDPLVSGVLGAALVRGLQSQGVGASLKHFAANNQEDDRMRISSDVDPRPLRELYLRGFQRVVESARPWTVMCSYNRINGVYSSENPWLLTDVLRRDWGYDGLVVSDWGAVNDRVTGLAAGLDLEMPGGTGATDAQLVAAVRNGDLDEALLDTAAERVVALVQRSLSAAPRDGYDREEHHRLAREAAARSIVLLKNDGGLLPLKSGTSLAVIGEFARTPRYQGAGSSLINPTRLDTALSEIEALAEGPVRFAPGFPLAGSPTDGTDPAELLSEAATAAGTAEVAIVFLGLPAADESEGYDREDIELPTAQLALLESVVAANPRTVVVLSNGGVVRLAPVVSTVPAILEGWLLGQAGGGALADVLLGRVNPSGRLAETIPERLEDTPAYLDFPGENGHVRYGEGIHVGYRWYDARALDVTFPFGHGLSYTTFSYDNAAAEATPEGVSVRVGVTNTGALAGREVVQVYIGLPTSRVTRAPRELKAFAVVELAAGESREVELDVRRADLAYWDTRADRFLVEGGWYRIEIGASSRDIRAVVDVDVPADAFTVPLSLDSSLGEVLAHPTAGALLRKAMSSGPGGLDAMAQDEGMLRMMASFPVGRLAGFPGVGASREDLERLIAEANAAD